VQSFTARMPLLTATNVHSHQGKDAGVLLNSVPINKELNIPADKAVTATIKSSQENLKKCKK